LSIEFFSVRVVFSQETPIGNVFEILFTSETCSLKRDNGIYLFIWFRDSPVFFRLKINPALLLSLTVPHF
jgi:hypothetical protein